jgi:deoxycytidine triphosphate deaminase
MYLNPNQAIQEGWITFPSWMDKDFRDKCIQPNALDFTADYMHSPDGGGLILSETRKVMRPLIPTLPHILNDDTEYFPIESNTYVDVTSDFYVSIPPGVAALMIIRSTLNRNGLFITSGLFDSGYSGSVGCALHNRGPIAYIAPHTRIGQIIFVKSEDSGLLYSGSYNHAQNTHWSGELNRPSMVHAPK